VRASLGKTANSGKFEGKENDVMRPRIALSELEPGLRPRNGGEVVVEALRIHGVDTVFCVPGESILPIMDAFYAVQDDIRFILCRHEGAAGNMADAHGKLTGKPGICLVNRGPGATNASTAVHTAHQDSSPMILLVGQVSRHAIGREAWMEIDPETMFASMAKAVIRVELAERIPEAISRAFHVATSGRPGPVVVVLAEELVYDKVVARDAGPYTRVETHAGETQMRVLRQELSRAKRPFVVLGGGGWTAEGCAAFQRFAERFDLPVGTGFRRQDLIDNRHPNFIGDMGLGIAPSLSKRVEEADLILAVGSRLSEASTKEYQLFDSPRPKQRLIHIHQDPGELGRVYQADLYINSGMDSFAEQAALLAGFETISWRGWTRAMRAEYEASLVPPPVDSALDLGAVMAHLRETLPRDTIMTNGAGNYAGWVHRFYQYGGFRTQLAPASGAMGYGVPAAIAAKLAQPQKMVVCFAGDGCFLMAGQELATVMQYGLKIIFIVFNNRMLGTVRMVQELSYPGRVIGSDMYNPDFAALAVAYGLHGEIVKSTSDFPGALKRATAADKSTLIELYCDPEIISSRTTLSALQKRA
jgi:acetolactate synthase-1/2/3 large subunit